MTNPLRWYIERVIDQKAAENTLRKQLALRVEGQRLGLAGTLYRDDWRPDPELVARLPRNIRRRVVS